MPQRAAGYIRVSTVEQTEGLSLSAQRREIKRYAEQHGHALVDVYADEGLSAHVDDIAKRPALTALLADAEAGKFDTVIVHTIDRWARNSLVQRLALQQLGEAGVGFVSITEGHDFSSPSGKLMLTMIGGFAEFSSDQLSVHVRKGVKERAEQGLHVGPVPFGFEARESRTAATPVKREAEAVRDAFARRAAGASYSSIAMWLNNQGFVTRKGRAFSEYAIRDLLKTRFYLGVITYLGTEHAGQHEAIVSEELFQRVAALRVRREPQRRSRGGESGILRGMIYCGHCGETIWSESHHSGRPIYRERQATRCAAMKRSAKAETIDAQVAQILESIELPTGWGGLIAESAVSDESRADLDALQTRRRRLVRAYADGGFTEAEYEVRLTAIDTAIRDATNTAAGGPSLEAAASLIHDLPALWSRATQDERRQLVQPLVERVYVDLGSARIGGLQPTPEFGTLLEHAIRKSDHPDVRLLTQDEALRWSEVEVELVETGES